MLGLGVVSLLLGVAAPSASPPPIRLAPREEGSPERVQQLATWTPGDISCGNGETLPGSLINAPIPQRLRRSTSLSAPITLEFTLGPEGRAMSIATAEGSQLSSRAFDLPPALAGSALPTFATPQQCRVTFEETMGPLEEASLEDLVRMRAYNRSVRVPSEAWQRIVPGDCSEKPRPRPLTLGYPDFRGLPKPQGDRNWVFLSYDTDADGRPTNLEIVESSGSSELKTQATEAVARSQFTEGNRTGCLRYFWTGAGVVSEPERLDLDSYGDQPEACDADDKWAREPVLRYPETYRRRGIEGWVVMRYDVAPWGETGNIRVIDSQPTDDLGRFAVSVLNSAQYKEQEAGLTGCITRVRFRLPAPAVEEDE